MVRRCLLACNRTHARGSLSHVFVRSGTRALARSTHRVVCTQRSRGIEGEEGKRRTHERRRFVRRGAYVRDRSRTGTHRPPYGALYAYIEERYLVGPRARDREREYGRVCMSRSRAIVCGRCTRAWLPSLRSHTPPPPTSPASTSFFYLPARPTHMCMCTLVFSVRSEPAENARYCYIIIIIIVRGQSRPSPPRRAAPRPCVALHFTLCRGSGPWSRRNPPTRSGKILSRCPTIVPGRACTRQRQSRCIVLLRALPPRDPCGVKG